jgi:hypothetical protein
VARNQTTQRQRTKNNPLVLGTFNQTSLRLLKGTLGPASQVIGRADTWDTSNGGYGGGAYNHWFQINLLTSAWIITVKGGPRPNYIQVSTYDLNQNPIEARGIFDKDSIQVTADGRTYYPYIGHTMGSQSDLTNNFNPNLIDRGDSRYFILPAGSYLLCISTTRNEKLDYTVGLVVEFEDFEPEYLLETGAGDYLVFESASSPATLLDPVNHIYFDTPPGYTGDQEHQHSLGEWRDAWDREHQQDNRFPAIFEALATTS